MSNERVTIKSSYSLDTTHPLYGVKTVVSLNKYIGAGKKGSAGADASSPYIEVYDDSDGNYQLKVVNPDGVEHVTPNLKFSSDRIYNSSYVAPCYPAGFSSAGISSVYRPNTYSHTSLGNQIWRAVTYPSSTGGKTWSKVYNIPTVEGYRLGSTIGSGETYYIQGRYGSNTGGYGQGNYSFIDSQSDMMIKGMSGNIGVVIDYASGVKSDLNIVNKGNTGSSQTFGGVEYGYGGGYSSKSASCSVVAPFDGIMVYRPVDITLKETPILCGSQGGQNNQSPWLKYESWSNYETSYGSDQWWDRWIQTQIKPTTITTQQGSFSFTAEAQALLVRKGDRIWASDVNVTKIVETTYMRTYYHGVGGNYFAGENVFYSCWGLGVSNDEVYFYPVKFVNVKDEYDE